MREAGPRRRSLRAGLRSARASVLAVWSEIDKPVRIAAVLVLTIVALSTVLLRFAYQNYSVTGADGRPISFGWLQALYFTTTIVATVGFGDFSFAREAGWLTAFGIFLILVGAAAVATLYALVTNFVLSQRLEQAFGRKRAITARGHIVVIGLGSIGLAVVEGLLAIGREVIVVEHDNQNRNLGSARARKVPVVIGDATSPTVLRQANIAEAAAVAVMTSSDLANVESALSARAAYAASRPDRERLRVVVRIFDTALADKVQKRFGVSVVRSASALAAPWFVGAALGHEVVSTFYAQRQPFLVARMRVRPGGGLDGTALDGHGRRAPGRRRIATRRSRRGRRAAIEVDDVGEDSADYRLTRNTRLQAGSEVLLVGTYQRVVAAFRANEPLTSISLSTSRMIPTVTPPTETIARSSHDGIRRATTAPNAPPQIDPSAMSPAASQDTELNRMNSTAATAFTSPASTFFVAFSRCRSSSTSRPMTASRITPCAAPK